MRQLLKLIISFLGLAMFSCLASAVTNSSASGARQPASLAPAYNVKTFPLDYCEVDCESRDSLPVDLRQVYTYVQEQNRNKFDYSKIIPTDLANGQDANTAVNKIADKGLQYWWNNSDAKQTPIGHSMSTVENSMKTDVDLGQVKGVKQNLNLGYDAFQGQAKINYTGYTNAELYYRTSDASMGAKIINKLDKNKDLIFGETIRSSSDQTTDVTFKWGF